MLSTEKMLKILRAKSFEDMELVIADILIEDDSPNTKELIELIATDKCKIEYWIGDKDKYKIPNVNGKGRPLTLDEIEDIKQEDRLEGNSKRNFWSRNY